MKKISLVIITLMLSLCFLSGYSDRNTVDDIITTSEKNHPSNTIEKTASYGTCLPHCLCQRCMEATSSLSYIITTYIVWENGICEMCGKQIGISSESDNIGFGEFQLA